MSTASGTLEFIDWYEDWIKQRPEVETVELKRLSGQWLTLVVHWKKNISQELMDSIMSLCILEWRWYWERTHSEDKA